MMRKILAPAIFAAALGGCAVVPQYGNFVQTTDTINKSMADDTLAQLVSLYPPALTRINMQQTTTDKFGTDLLASMRQKGYSVAEYAPPQGGAVRSTPNASASLATPASEPQPVLPAPAATTANPGIDLRYVVDAPACTNIYRVTVTIGNQSITRAYVPQQSGSVAPAGSWVRKE